VWGCYIHGIFANERFRRGWLSTLGWCNLGAAPLADPYDRLADHVAANIDLQLLEKLLESG
jgi:adenosylcobyric acid synthase